MELVLGVIALVSLFLVVAGKYFVTIRLQQLRQLVIESEVNARTARSKLKQIETQSGLAGREVKTKERKRQSLEKQIEKYKKELAELRR
jgi:septal ring factor EnvC (AmiA/AmiB activator)